jgi:hypothetical protein
VMAFSISDPMTRASLRVSSTFKDARLLQQMSQ